MFNFFFIQDRFFCFIFRIMILNVGRGTVGSFELEAVGLDSSSSNAGLYCRRYDSLLMSRKLNLLFLHLYLSLSLRGFSSESCETCLCFNCNRTGSVNVRSSELESSSATGCITCSIVSSGLSNCVCG